MTNVDLKQLPGNRESPYSFEHYRNFRYAKEDQFPLWRKGGSGVALLDPQSFNVEWEFADFWPKDYIPMKYCVARDFSKVYGFSFSNAEGIFTILNVNRQNKSVQNKTIKIPKEQKWVGLETTTQGDILIVTNAFKQINPQTGAKENFLKMMAIDCSNMKINVIAQQDFHGTSVMGTQLSRKFKGYDIFCVCAGANINIIAYQDQKFHMIQTVPNIYNDRIIDVAIYRNYIIPLTLSKNERVKVIEFNAQSYNSMVKQSELKSSRIGLNKSNIKASLFRDQNIKRIDLPNMSGRKRIDVSFNGKTIYFGGRGGLNVLKRDSYSQDFQLFGTQPPTSKLFFRD